MDSNESLLLNLPVELFELIVSLLPVHDRFYLAQVCRTARYFAGQRWKEVVTDEDGNKSAAFVLGIALYRDNAWVYSTPNNNNKVVWFEKDECLKSKRYCSEWNQPRAVHAQLKYYTGGPIVEIGKEYWVNNATIQQALKYTIRGQTTKAEKYLKPYAKTKRVNRVVSGGTFSFLHKPAVIDGRFVTYCEYKISLTDGSDFTSTTLQNCLELSICLHKKVSWANPWGFEFPELGREIFDHCEYCASDCSTLVEGSHMRIRTWRDFGTYWTTVPDLGGQWTNQWTPPDDNERRPGSVRAMWEANQGALSAAGADM